MFHNRNLYRYIVNVLSIFKSKSVGLKLPKYGKKCNCALVFFYFLFFFYVDIYNASTSVDHRIELQFKTLSCSALMSSKSLKIFPSISREIAE